MVYQSVLANVFLWFLLLVIDQQDSVLAVDSKLLLQMLSGIIVRICRCVGREIANDPAT